MGDDHNNGAVNDALTFDLRRVTLSGDARTRRRTIEEHPVWSQQRVADAAHVPVAAVTDLEDAHPVDLEHLRRICTVIGLPFDQALNTLGVGADSVALFKRVEDTFDRLDFARQLRALDAFDKLLWEDDDNSAPSSTT